MKLYFPDITCDHADDFETVFLSGIPVFFRDRNRIWKNDRRSQHLGSDTAKRTAIKCVLLYHGIFPDVLWYLPCQQLHASDHPYRYFSTGSV